LEEGRENVEDAACEVKDAVTIVVVLEERKLYLQQRSYF
jgi:hypothetical protein